MLLHILALAIFQIASPAKGGIARTENPVFEVTDSDRMRCNCRIENRNLIPIAIGPATQQTMIVSIKPGK